MPFGVSVQVRVEVLRWRFGEMADTVPLKGIAEIACRFDPDNRYDTEGLG